MGNLSRFLDAFSLVCWVLVVLLADRACSFSFASPVFGLPKGSGSRTPDQHHDSMRSCSVALSASSLNKNPTEVNRNMFQSALYNKPIVLLGCSGAGGEMHRLAESLRVAMKGVATKDPQDLGAESGERMPLAGITDEGTFNVEKEELLSSIEKKRSRVPEVIVLDFDDADFSIGEGKHAAELSNHYTELAKSLYEDAGLLSVYVNVHPEQGQMSREASERKTSMEDDVFVQYSDYELCIKDEGLKEDAWSHIEWELRRIVARALLVPAAPGGDNSSVNSPFLTMGKHTFFLSLSFPDITEVEPYVKEMCQDVDAMEYRTDLLKCRDNRFDLIYGQQLLRKYCRPHAKRSPGLPSKGMVIDDAIPIVYTVRTQNQAGTYPDGESDIEKMFQMLEWGLRSGVEVLDVESAWDEKLTDELLTLAEERYSTQILGSHHVVGKEIATEEAVELFQQCALSGRAHGAKVVLSIDSEEKDRMAYEAATIASSLAERDGKPVIPNVSLVLGDVGKYSRVLNFPFTPVTHESLPFKAAPGQLTSSEIMTTRLLLKLFSPMRYCILGHNIAYSVSPQMQGSAFAATRLPHEYYLADVPTVEEFVESDFFKADDFGGCSVTIPHKQAIIPYVDVMSDAATTIGSVNTLVVREEYRDDDIQRVIYGDNTDWRGIYNPLERKLGGKQSSDMVGFALIVGAGGTARAGAYAAEKLGLQRLYYNRTPEKAKELANTFGGIVVTSLDDSSTEDGKNLGDVLKEENASLRVVISTLPAGAEFVLPKWLLSTDDKPVVFDVNYKPFNTKLLLQAEACGCQLVRGSEMLWEQGVGQFELWTERTAPYKVMKDAVLENCIPKEENVTERVVEEPETVTKE